MSNQKQHRVSPYVLKYLRICNDQDKLIEVFSMNVINDTAVRLVKKFYRFMDYSEIKIKNAQFSEGSTFVPKCKQYYSIWNKFQILHPTKDTLIDLII